VKRACLSRTAARTEGCDAINHAIGNANEAAAIEAAGAILDRYALAIVDINAEGRVKVQGGFAKPELVEGGRGSFLVKVINKAGVTAPLTAESPNSLPIFVQSDSSPEPPKKISSADTRNRWMGLELYDKDPMSLRLSGLPLEYRILQSIAGDQGQRSAAIGFNVGQGTQDIGFRNEVVVVFTALAGPTVAAVGPRRERRSVDGGLHNPRRIGPALSESLKAPGTRSVFPAASLSRERRDHYRCPRVLTR